MHEKTVKGSRVTTLYFVMLALFTALATVATVLVRIPCGPLGYVNFGDAIVMIAAVVLGPAGGAIVGGLGPAIADAISGAFVYVPFTAVIKTVEGLLVGLLYTKVLPSRASWLRCLLAFLAATVWVTIGYAVADCLLVLFGVSGFDAYGVRAAFIAGAVTMPFTLVQMGVSTVIAMFVSPKLPTLAHEKLFNDPAEPDNKPDEKDEQ